ncbi:hypothetical protein HHK36_001996 [Tetracentron sinense]|uniref:Wound-responsive family protein n=1 Tax=Tetracentron sinense TaxID=13715 RepID=A0A835DRK6_TETSI|nr:hypothetical protein HHK36_001996 [Tetracentron sinense]
MSSTSKAWIVAASVGAVEVLKDQGFCRWNYALRSLHQHAKNNLRSFSQAKRLPPSSSSMMILNKKREEKMKESEESLRKVIVRIKPMLTVLPERNFLGKVRTGGDGGSVD